MQEILRELLLLGESQSVEFKTVCRLEALGCQVCAFLNASGGFVVCGVEDSGQDIPYAFHNEVFVRDGDQTVQADIETIREMVMRRQVEPERWERRCPVRKESSPALSTGTGTGSSFCIE